MKKHLYNENGTGVNGGISEIDDKIKAFVDDVCDNFGDYLDADLELYVLEEIMARFCHKRIHRQVEEKNK